MEHRGIEYQIKIGITKHEWAWSIRTSPPKQGKVSGSRDDAVYEAALFILTCCLSAAVLVARAIISPSFLLNVGVSNDAISLPYIQSRADLSELMAGSR